MTPTAVIECNAVLFDLDGVLVDSNQCVDRILRRWCERHGLDATAVIRTARGRRSAETVTLVAPYLDAATEVAWLVACESTETEGVAEVPGARELIARLPARLWAVVTSGTRPVAELRIRHVGLPSPPVLISAEDVRRGKPDPEPYRVAAERLRVAPSACIVVEDAAAGIDAARSAGMRSIGILGSDGTTLDNADWVAPSLGWLHVQLFGEGLQVIVRRPNEASDRQIGASPPPW
jgi:sugar-phosphatase